MGFTHFTTSKALGTGTEWVRMSTNRHKRIRVSVHSVCSSVPPKKQPFFNTSLDRYRSETVCSQTLLNLDCM